MPLKVNRRQLSVPQSHHATGILVHQNHNRHQYHYHCLREEQAGSQRRCACVQTEQSRHSSIHPFSHYDWAHDRPGARGGTIERASGCFKTAKARGAEQRCRCHWKHCGPATPAGKSKTTAATPLSRNGPKQLSRL